MNGKFFNDKHVATLIIAKVKSETTRLDDPAEDDLLCFELLHCVDILNPNKRLYSLRFLHLASINSAGSLLFCRIIKPLNLKGLRGFIIGSLMLNRLE